MYDFFFASVCDVVAWKKKPYCIYVYDCYIYIYVYMADLNDLRAIYYHHSIILGYIICLRVCWNFSCCLFHKSWWLKTCVIELLHTFYLYNYKLIVIIDERPYKLLIYLWLKLKLDLKRSYINVSRFSKMILN